MEMQTKKTTKLGMRFQQRDAEILEAVHKYDGILAKRQLQKLFWPNASFQAMERRLALLHRHGYLDIPSADQRRTNPIAEPIIWLGWRGALHIATALGTEVEPPQPANENQLRRLEKRLREAGIRWQREPRWSQIAHDIAVNDFRISVEQAVQHWPSLSLQEWLPEGEFLTNTDTIEVVTDSKRRKGVRPDGFFVLVDHMREIRRSPAKARFLLELDNSTHPLSRFGRDKAVSGLAYIRSDAYRKRFGFNSGRWLVVCKSPERMKHIKRQTEKVLGRQAANFLFTTMQEVQHDTVLTKPIWRRGGSFQKIPLIGNIGVGR